MQKVLMSIKNWQEFQHYKDRAPPWIKFHKKLLDDYEYQCLPLASRALAPMLWLLASESLDGTFNGSVDFLSFRLRQPKADIETGLKSLIDNGFVIPCDVTASSLLASCYQLDTPETETETETETENRDRGRETEAKTKAKKFDAKKIELPECINPQAWDEWLAYRKSRKLTCTEQTMAAQLRNLEHWHNQGHDPNAIIAKSIECGWAGLFEPKKTNQQQIGTVDYSKIDYGEQARKISEMLERKNVIQQNGD